MTIRKKEEKKRKQNQRSITDDGIKAEGLFLLSIFSKYFVFRFFHTPKIEKKKKRLTKLQQTKKRKSPSAHANTEENVVESLLCRGPDSAAPVQRCVVHEGRTWISITSS